MGFCTCVGEVCGKKYYDVHCYTKWPLDFWGGS